MTSEVLALILTRAKLVLRISKSIFDDEIKGLIKAAYADLQHTAGIVLDNLYVDDELDELLVMAILTYVRAHFGQPEDADQMLNSYDIQKAQLKTANAYTDWEA